MKTIEFWPARLLCRSVRDFLKECQFKGMDITFIEGSGWIERKFIIRGSKSHVNLVGKWLVDWSKSL